MRRRVNQAGPFENFFQEYYQKIDLLNEARRSRRNCLTQLKALQGGYNGNMENFKNEVLPFWKRYKIKPKKMWYDLYCFSDNKYNPLYIPGDLYWQKIYPALNKVAFRRAYTNKCFYDTIFPYLKKPGTILYNINGLYFDGKGESISLQKACQILKNKDSYVLKPGFYSGGGKDIYFRIAGSNSCNSNGNHNDINSNNGNRKKDNHNKNNRNNKVTGISDTKYLLELYKTDFIVQELVNQHETLSLIHPASLNTIRTISFFLDDKVYISSSLLRMGTFGNNADNFSMGGIACPINTDGRLKKFAVSPKMKWMSHHPSSGIKFESIKVPSYNRVLELIKKAHTGVPFFKIIGWDFAIDKNGEPVFIEYNGAPDLNQLSCGPLFGELTKGVLDSIFR